MHKRLWFNNKRNDHFHICPCIGELARMLISADGEGEYTQQQKEYADRRIRAGLRDKNAGLYGTLGERLTQERKLHDNESKKHTPKKIAKETRTE
ncbi:MAG: hypothetical protein WBX14_06585 [Candidatus Udaeobacter sp.]